MTVEISEVVRQVIILALAELSLSRPGWHTMLSETAIAFGGMRAIAEFETFKLKSADRVKARLPHDYAGEYPLG